MRKDKTRRVDRTRQEKSSGPSPALFSNLNRLAEEIRSAQDQFEQLNAENQRLREQLNQQSQELVRAQRLATDLTAECESLKRAVERAEVEVERSRTDALVALFKDMADERHNRLLRKLLAFEGDEPELLRDLADYLRDNLKLTLEGQIDNTVRLEETNLDHYEFKEAVNLPCKAQIIGRGISFEERTVLRTQVELVEGEVNDGD